MTLSTNNNTFTLERTSIACPEQYDVYIIGRSKHKNNLVGYVRLRGGKLTCECPDVDGELVYYTIFPDERGSFETDSERDYYLKDILTYIENWLRNKK